MSPIDWGAPDPILHEARDPMSDEDDEEDVNWELQHSSVRGYQYDDDDDEEGIVPQYFSQDEDVIVPASWVDEDEDVR